MSLSRPRAIRQLCVLLACAVMWLSVGAARAATAPGDTVVLVDTTTERFAPPAKSDAKAAPTLRVSSAATRLARRVPTNGAAKQVVIARCRYLQHCALLL
jgi:hypothetical protein